MSPDNGERKTDSDGLTWEYLEPPGTWVLVSSDAPLFRPADPADGA